MFSLGDEKEEKKHANIEASNKWDVAEEGKEAWKSIKSQEYYEVKKRNNRNLEWKNKVR